MFKNYSNKLKTTFLLGGFLIIVSLAGFIFLISKNFLAPKDKFLNSLPTQTVLYWHNNQIEKENSWLYDVTPKLLEVSAARQAEILFQEILPYSNEIAFALLPPTPTRPGFQDFIFLSNLGTENFNIVKEKLKNLNFNYILENNGRIIITNSKNGFKKILSVRSKKISSLADQEKSLFVLNQANQFPGQIFLKNFKFKNLPTLNFTSSLFTVNKLIIQEKETSRAALGHNYLLTLSGYDFQNLEQNLQKILALLLPEVKEKILPDETQIQELVADPSRFNFEKEQINDLEVNYLNVPEWGVEFFASEKEGGEIILSNSKELFLTYSEKEKDPPSIKFKKDFLRLLRKSNLNFSGFVLGILYNVDKL